MGKALYRKYRSKSLDEIIGQEHITDTLRNALKAGNLSHAYLFTGPRGTGKTSIARILAHEINQLPYEDETTHLDIIEIDAASNRRIDEIRELRERVHTAPTSAKYKVYIIDEVHMLTKEAFNALLKTLEEPPAHAVFILATTEAHKLPETIVSRTQRFTFKPVDKDKVIAHLKYIAEQEGFSVDDEGLQLLASHGGGSFRDSISMLDQARGHGTSVTLANVQSLLGLAPTEMINGLLKVLRQGTPADVVSELTIIKDQGYQAGQIAKQLSAEIRQQILAGQGDEQSLALLEKLLNVPAAHDQMASLELALIERVLANGVTKPAPIQDVVEAHNEPEELQPAPVDDIPPENPPELIVESLEQELAPEITKDETVTQAAEQFDADTWDKALNIIKQTHNTLYSMARMADPTIEGDELTLTFGFAFHQKRLNEAKNRQVITDIVQKVSGKPITINCVVGKTVVKPQALQIEPPVAATTSSNDTLSAISNIFGGAEVLESN
jgi:DNA polymerase-3 subunit gamma/tau